MQTEEKVIYSSLLKAQAELPVMGKDCNAGRYKYASLDIIVKAVKPILAKHGLSFLQLISNKDGKSTLITRIYSADGNYIESECFLPMLDNAKMNSVQAVGASITYMKRYSLTAMLGIVADDDVDARVASISVPVIDDLPSEEKKIVTDPVEAVAQVMGGTFEPTIEQFKELCAIMNTEKDGKPVLEKDVKERFKKKYMASTKAWRVEPKRLIQLATEEIELASVPF